MTAFTPFYLSAEKNVPHVNLSLAHTGPGSNLELDELQSNYTVEISFPDGGHVYQNSSVNITATIHRAGYTNRTDTPMELCAFMNRLDSIEWHPQELKNRSQSQPFAYSIKALIPSDKIVHSPGPQRPCREITSAVAADLTQEGRVSSASSEPLSFSLFVYHDAVPDFSTYYQRLLHHISLTLHIKPDPSDPWDHEWEKEHWEKQAAEMDDPDFDWVPWLPFAQTRRRFLSGQVDISVTPMHRRGYVRSMPVHYLSDEARQPSFVDSSDIAGFRSISPEERDLIAPLAQPSIKVFAEGEELRNRYFTEHDVRRPIYVGDTWANKVLPMLAEGHGTDTVDHLFVVQ